MNFTDCYLCADCLYSTTEWAFSVSHEGRLGHTMVWEGGNPL